MQIEANKSNPNIIQNQYEYQYINIDQQQTKFLQSLAEKNPEEDAINILKKIYQYNLKKIDQDNLTLQNLRSALDGLSQENSNTFLNQTLPIMAQSALHILKNKTKIPLMVKTQSIQLSKLHLFQFLSMQFFHFRKNQSIGNNFQFPNGSYVFIIEDSLKKFVSQEKLKCHIHYFNKAAKENAADQFVSFHRISNHKNVWPNWYNSKASLKEINFTTKPIESFKNSIIVDFANKYFGGGVLGRGCVQEEILLSLMPEAMAAIFFTSKLEDQDAFYIDNATTYSNYSGYGKGFKFEQQDPINNNQMILAMDAQDYMGAEDYHFYFQQFNYKNIVREINKAYISFSQGQVVKDDIQENINNQELKINQKQNIITGKWGCGAFGGNVELKLLIQLIAFSQTKAFIQKNLNLHFSTFQNEQEATSFQSKLGEIITKFQTVGSLSIALFKLDNLKEQGFKMEGDSLIDYLLQN